MRDQIHTIPVLDALRDPQGCAFCTMKKKLETSAVRFIMGPAYMEEDVRMDTNKVGFCKSHMDALYNEQNRLGLALMLHTHLQQIYKDTEHIASTSSPAKLFKKSPMFQHLREHMAKTHASCYICRRIDDAFDRYVDTFFYLWKKNGDEAKLIEGQTSYCMPHFLMLFEKGEKFKDVLLPLWQKIVQELEADLDWFTQKFDHRNADAPWKNSKDALPRAIDFLGGY